MSDESLVSDELLTKIMKSVRIELRTPMRIRISKLVRGKITDTHTLEIELGADILQTQKAVVSVASRWKGGFDVGTQYTVERLE